MKYLVISAHPLSDSLCMSLTGHVVGTLQGIGHDVEVLDLYGSGFDPLLSVAERATYYHGDYDTSKVAAEVRQLLDAEAIVFVFPTWWFGFPAILKGWFDRVWAPGVAYDHASDFGPITPRLHDLKRVLAITTLGAPWWVDFFVMRRPVRRVLKIALLYTSAPKCRFKMLSLYKCEDLGPAKVDGFKRRIADALSKWR